MRAADVKANQRERVHEQTGTAGGFAELSRTGLEDVFSSDNPIHQRISPPIRLFATIAF